MNDQDDNFVESKKERKLARKVAIKKDRSKFKKTDVDKKIKQQLLARERKMAKKELLKGRVLSIIGARIIVDHEQLFYDCTLKGSLKQEMMHEKNLVTVGDFVFFEKTDHLAGIIHHVEERRSLLSRLEHLRRRQRQLIAANIDQVFITVSVVSPPLKLSLIDRYIIATYKGNMEPVILINKIDLLKDHEEEEALFEICVATYRALGLVVIPLSAATGEGIDELKKQMKDRASVFSGQSGVGKSSLINTALQYALAVGAIVDKTNKGSHTTTNASLLPLEFGGYCIDTPGIRSFGVWDLKLEDLYTYFPEIYEKSRECRFADCTHMQEPGCALLSAVEKGEISPFRFDSYLKLLEEVS